MTETELYKDLADFFIAGLEDTDFEDIVIDWPGLKLEAHLLKDETTGHAIPWIRYNYKPVTGGQLSLSGDDGHALFGTAGLIVLQIFTPPGQGLRDSLEIAEVCRKVYDGKVTTGGVWFRNARPQNVGISGGWYQSNVSVNFEYRFKR